MPDIAGMNLAEAEKALRDKNLTLGQASPQPADPEGKISSQIPAADEIVKAGTPINIFYPDPSDAENKKKNADKDDKKGGGGAGGEKGDEKGGGGRRGHRRAGDRQGRHAGRLRQEARRPRHRPGRLQAVQRRQAAARRSAPTRPAAPRWPPAPRSRCSSPSASRRSSTPTARTSCASTAPRRQARTRGHRPRQGGRPDLDRRRRPRRLHRPTAASMLKDLTKKNAAPVPLHARGRALRRPRVGADRRRQPDRHARRPTRTAPTDLCLANVKGDETDITCKDEPSLLDHPRAALGQERALDPRPRRQGRRASSGSCAGA